MSSGRLTNADFENVVILLRLINSMGRYTHTSTAEGKVFGFTAAEIKIQATNTGSTLTDDQIDDLLNRGANSGVFIKHCLSTQLDFHCADETVVGSVYAVNQGMVKQNPANARYATFFNGIDIHQHQHDADFVHGGNFGTVSNVGCGFGTFSGF